MSLFGSGRPIDPLMPVHLDVLGRLHVLLGALAVLAGSSLFLIALGTRLALADLSDAGAVGQAGVWILVWCGVVFVAGGLALVLTGRALARRRPSARQWALILAVPDLLAVPFGTALSVYAFWVLLNDEARREFGRPPRLPQPPSTPAVSA
jgi:hypothetical protein